MKKIAIAVITVLAVAVFASAALAVTVESTTGKGWGLLDGDTKSFLSFKAGVDDAGAFFGEMQYKEKTGRTTDVKFHGDVDYFEADVESGIACFTGIIDSASDPSLVGERYVVWVLDSADGDRYEVDFPTNQDSCRPQLTPDIAVVGGNIQVR